MGGPGGFKVLFDPDADSVTIVFVCIAIGIQESLNKQWLEDDHSIGFGMKRFIADTCLL